MLSIVEDTGNPTLYLKGMGGDFEMLSVFHRID